MVPSSKASPAVDSAVTPTPVASLPAVIPVNEVAKLPDMNLAPAPPISAPAMLPGSIRLSAAAINLTCPTPLPTDDAINIFLAASGSPLATAR